jgi:hypothetical protein
LELKVKAKKFSGIVVDGFHFQRDTYKSWGMPFHFVVSDEELDATKERLAKKIGVSVKEMDKIKIKWVTKGNRMVNIEGIFL